MGVTRLSEETGLEVEDDGPRDKFLRLTSGTYRQVGTKRTLNACCSVILMVWKILVSSRKKLTLGYP